MRARAGRQGDAAGARRAAAGERPAAEEQLTRAAAGDAHLAFLHRPPDLRLRALDRVRDPGRGGLCPPAGRPISRDRAADHQRHRPISRRQRGGRRGDGGRADRGADQRRREHALRVLELERGRPLHHRGDLRSRHQSRHRAGAGAEPRRHRAAAAAGRGSPGRRHRQQELARPDDGRAPVLAGQDARHALHLELRHAGDQGRSSPASTASARSPCSAAATMRCGSGSTRIACSRSG